MLHSFQSLASASRDYLECGKHAFVGIDGCVLEEKLRYATALTCEEDSTKFLKLHHRPCGSLFKGLQPMVLD